MATFNDDTYHHCCDAIPADVDPSNFTPFSVTTSFANCGHGYTGESG
jgi:hypothetical protein